MAIWGTDIDGNLQDLRSLQEDKREKGMIPILKSDVEDTMQDFNTISIDNHILSKRPNFDGSLQILYILLNNKHDNDLIHLFPLHLENKPEYFITASINELMTIQEKRCEFTNLEYFSGQ